MHDFEHNKHANIISYFPLESFKSKFSQICNFKLVLRPSKAKRNTVTTFAHTDNIYIIGKKWGIRSKEQGAYYWNTTELLFFYK